MKSVYNQPLPPIVAMAACLLAASGCRPESSAVPTPPPPVTVARPVQTEIKPFVEATGTTEATEEVEVRSRVRGIVQEAPSHPGGGVEEGEKLYAIEPDQYQTAFDSARAAVDAAEAAIQVAQAAVSLAQARVTQAENALRREERLKAENASTEADYERAVAATAAAQAERDAAQANVAVAEAQRKNAIALKAEAELDLDYTTITAPITGKISKTEVKVGNLVEFGTVLTRIVDGERMYANFTISDRQLLEFMESRREAADTQISLDLDSVDVYLQREGDQGFPFAGKLDYIDQTGVNPEFGTMAMRAVFKNPDRRLVPGLFVTLRIPRPDPVQRLVVKEVALGRSPQGTFLRVVNDAERVEQVFVTVAETFGGWAFIEEGLEPDARVVVTGVQKALPGMEVNATTVELDVDTDVLRRGLPEGTVEAATAPASPPPSSD